MAGQLLNVIDVGASKCKACEPTSTQAVCRVEAWVVTEVNCDLLHEPHHVTAAHAAATEHKVVAMRLLKAAAKTKQPANGARMCSAAWNVRALTLLVDVSLGLADLAIGVRMWLEIRPAKTKQLADAQRGHEAHHQKNHVENVCVCVCVCERVLCSWAHSVIQRKRSGFLNLTHAACV